ncbi:MAG: response regulator transcription factor [Vulcanimicrobiaceae bacterium]
MRILVAEPDPGSRTTLTGALNGAGYEVEAVGDRAAAERLSTQGGFGAVVLDWTPPAMPGFNICQRLREAEDSTPVIILTARTGLEDRMKCMDAGADDYLVKPFSIDEFLARLSVAIRRVETLHTKPFTIGAVTIDPGARLASVAERPVQLTEKEYRLLAYLASNVGIGLRREAIEQHVWGYDFDGTSNFLDAMVARLRKKLGRQGADTIETLRDFGYRLKR